MKNKKIKNGFSIIEVMFASAVLVTGLVASANLVVSALRNSMANRDRIIATQLSQEGVELVKNIWENNHANVDSLTRNNCNVDYQDPAISLAAGNCADAYDLYANTDGFYERNNGPGHTLTKFSRRIKLTAGTEITVESMVSWKGAPPDLAADCTVSNSCAYTVTILADWR